MSSGKRGWFSFLDDQYGEIYYSLQEVQVVIKKATRGWLFL